MITTNDQVMTDHFLMQGHITYAQAYNSDDPYDVATLIATYLPVKEWSALVSPKALAAIFARQRTDSLAADQLRRAISLGFIMGWVNK